MEIYLALLGAMICTYCLMALRMSLYRMALNGRPESAIPGCEIFYEGQMLFAEWTAPICAALLGAHIKFGSKDDSAAAQIARYSAIALVSCRLFFAGAAVITIPRPIRITSMTICYVALLVLSVTILATSL